MGKKLNPGVVIRLLYVRTEGGRYLYPQDLGLYTPYMQPTWAPSSQAPSELQVPLSLFLPPGWNVDRKQRKHTHTQQYPDIIFSIYVYYRHTHTHTHVYICVCVCVCVWSRFSRVQLFVTLWTVAHQAPLSLGFPRQEYQSGLPFPLPGILPSQGSNLSLFSLLLCRRILYCWATRKAYKYIYIYIYITYIYRHFPFIKLHATQLYYSCII